MQTKLSEWTTEQTGNTSILRVTNRRQSKALTLLAGQIFIFSGTIYC